MHHRHNHHRRCLSVQILFATSRLFSIALFLATFNILFDHATAVRNHVFPDITIRKPLWQATWTDKLKKDLLLNYDKYARPAQHYNTTEVFLDIEVHHVSLDDLKSVLSVHSWMQMKWTDQKLKWNSSNYGNITEIQLGAHEIWQPDVYLYNSAAGSMMEHYGDTHCVVYDGGKVLWVPPAQFLTFCNLDLRLWPYDSHTCQLFFGSWMYDGNEIDLQFYHNDTEGMQENLYIENFEWELVNISRKRSIINYACCEEPYITLIFNLTLHRRAKLYYNLVFTPTIPIVILTLLTFWLPPQSEMKLTLGGCNALIVTIISIYLGNKLPAAGNSVPLIVSFYTGCLYQITLSLILSVLVINMSKRPYTAPVPRIIKRLLLISPLSYLGLSDLVKTIKVHRPHCSQELHENHGVIADGVTASNYDDNERLNMLLPVQNITQLEWILLASVIDRISFVLFCISFTFIAIVNIA